MKKNLTILTTATLVLVATTMNAQTWNIGDVGSDVTATLRNDTLYIDGNGGAKNYIGSSERPPWYGQTFKNVVIGSGITSIGTRNGSGTDGTFSGGGVTDIYFLGTIPPLAYSYGSYNMTSFTSVGATFHVPIGSGTNYQLMMAINWQPLMNSYKIVEDIVINNGTISLQDSITKLQSELAVANATISALIVALANCGNSSTNVPLNNNKILQVYPNPTTNEIRISDLPFGESVEVYDLQGTRILSSMKSIVNISHLPAGIYIVRVGNKVTKVVKK